jgi:hypothetical protein
VARVLIHIPAPPGTWYISTGSTPTASAQLTGGSKSPCPEPMGKASAQLQKGH